VAEQPADGLVGVPVRAEQVGAEVADDVVLAVAGTSSTMPSEKPTA
jgi:hypothetical protein